MPKPDTLAEATRLAGQLTTAYRSFSDALRAHQWPEAAQTKALALAVEYDREFVQYETLAEATSVGCYRAVAYWMSSMTPKEIESRAGVRQALGLPAESRELVLNPLSSPATAMTAC
ncbi:hypothetical protein [Krasilnikovia sp. MM14-A1004]|uniref:hypothetical protein n=1 Tax=Krasilnikovia sp. MM14-A1004 TaxID=3373541 RepID=UPI00399C5B22